MLCTRSFTCGLSSRWEHAPGPKYLRKKNCSFSPSLAFAIINRVRTYSGKQDEPLFKSLLKKKMNHGSQKKKGERNLCFRSFEKQQQHVDPKLVAESARRQRGVCRDGRNGSKEGHSPRLTLLGVRAAYGFQRRASVDARAEEDSSTLGYMASLKQFLDQYRTAHLINSSGSRSWVPQRQSLARTIR